MNKLYEARATVFGDYHIKIKHDLNYITNQNRRLHCLPNNKVGEGRIAPEKMHVSQIQTQMDNGE